MPERRSSSGWITQVAVILLVAAAFLAWQSPAYWAQRVFSNSSAKTNATRSL